jgi:molybdate transport system substrate-binding protein
MPPENRPEAPLGPFRTARRTVAIASLLGLAVGCGAEDPPPARPRVYAAASLTDVLETLAGSLESAGRARPVLAFGATSTLAQQIDSGATPGVFLSASVKWADWLESRDLIERGTRVNLLGNSLVVIVPSGAKDRPASLQDLIDPRFGRLALADPEAVPAGTYARTALEKAGLYDGLRGRIVAAADVRTALAYVERGEIPVGIVYATDALASGKVDVALRIDLQLHPPIVYPMVLVKGADAQARAFHEFLQSPQARAVFEKAGFTRP